MITRGALGTMKVDITITVTGKQCDLFFYLSNLRQYTNSSYLISVAHEAISYKYSYVEYRTKHS